MDRQGANTVVGFTRDVPTLRDRFAMAALTGLLRGSDPSASDAEYEGYPARRDALVCMAYEYANAMLAAREAKR